MFEQDRFLCHSGEKKTWNDTGEKKEEKVEKKGD